MTGRARLSAAIGLLALWVSPERGSSQSIAARISAADGLVAVVYASRSGVCGDGVTYFANVLGNSNYFSGDAMFGGRSRWADRPCIHGPARVVATVVSGEVTRLRAYVGPVPSNDPRVTTITASADDAAQWLTELARRAPPRVAGQAVLPLVLADWQGTWRVLSGLAKDESRPRAVRQAATTWLAAGAADHLGLAQAQDESADDEMRSQAVFLLSQRNRSENLPVLMDLARSASHPATRRAAIFWLGQSGDQRAVDWFDQVLGIH